MQVHGTAPEPKAPGPPKSAHARAASGGLASARLPRRKGRPPKHGDDDDDIIYADGVCGDEEDGEATGTQRWSAVNRAERYRRRRGDESDAGGCRF